MARASEPKPVNLGAPTPARSRQSGSHPADEKELSRVTAHLLAQFGGQHWTRDRRRIEPMIYLNTTGPRGRQFSRAPPNQDWTSHTPGGSAVG